MSMSTQPRNYTLRQLRLPEEYQKKLHKVKILIANDTGRYPNMEIALCSMIDEFLSAHGIDTAGIEEGGDA
jgi:hypothetical protein